MQVPFDQILGKSNPLKLPDIAAVEAEGLAGVYTGCTGKLNVMKYTRMLSSTSQARWGG